LWCPLTYDKTAFIDLLQSVDTKIIPRGGTRIDSAIRTAEVAFLNDPKATKIMILITDGEDLSGELESQIARAARAGWIIHTVGIGTEEGELIPIVDDSGNSSFVTDEQGNVVKTKLDVASLELIASRTQGVFRKIGPTGEGLRDIFESEIKPALVQQEETRITKIMIDRYGWCIAVALILLAVELALRDTQKLRQPRASLLLVPAMIALSFATPMDANASTARDAQEAFDQQNYAQAQALYESAYESDREDASLSYNAGVSALASGNFEQAKHAFDAALNTENLPLQEKTLYNRASAQYHLGNQMLDTDPYQTVAHWESALKDYEGCMELNPEATDAATNHEKLKAHLERLKKLLQQNQNQEQNQNEDQQDQNEDQQNQNQQNDSQNQNQDQSSNDQKENESSSQDQQQEQQDSSQDEQSGEPDQQNDTEQQEQEAPQEPESDTPEESQDEPKSEEEQQQEPSEAGQEEMQGGQGQEEPLNPEEARALLESLENEDGDFSDVYFKMQDTADETDENKDW
jgi:Ca-activated chloride channel family protein